MTNRTMQEEFDIVVEHLVTQGVQCVDGDGNCVYRGPNGLKCAIGALIPDEQYLPEFDDFSGLGNTGVESLVKNWKPISLSSEHTEFYKRLQNAHDEYSNWRSKGFGNWELLERVARDYGLNTKTLDKYIK